MNSMKRQKDMTLEDEPQRLEDVQYATEGASLVAQMVKRLPTGRPRFDPWVRKIPWRRKWQPTLVFLPGKSHGQRSLVGYSPGGWSQRVEPN